MLHVGRRVRLGWCLPHRILSNRGHADPRLRPGVLEAGPYAPGTVFTGTDGGLYRLVHERAWRVRLDDGAVVATESHIVPEDEPPGVGRRTARRAARVLKAPGPSAPGRPWDRGAASPE